MARAPERRRDRAEEDRLASAAGGGGGGGGGGVGSSGAGSAEPSGRAAAASSSDLGGGGGGGGGSSGAAPDSVLRPERRAAAASSVASGVGGDRDGRRIRADESDEIEERAQISAASLLYILVHEGLESARAALSSDEKSLSRREARMAILQETDAQIRALTETVAADRGGATFTDVALMRSLTSIQRKYKNPDAKEIVDIIARHVSSAARTVARVAVNGGLSAAEKTKEIARAVSRFFTSVAAKLAVLKIEAAAAIANRFSKMADGIDSGKFRLANAMTSAGLRVVNAPDRVGAAIRGLGVRASESLKDVRHRVGHAIIPDVSNPGPRQSQRDERLKEIEYARDERIGPREVQAHRTKKDRRRLLMRARKEREESREDRSASAEADVQARKAKKDRDLRPIPGVHDAFVMPVKPSSTPDSGRPRRPSEREEGTHSL